jgi:hypothetical protein
VVREDSNCEERSGEEKGDLVERRINHQTLPQRLVEDVFQHLWQGDYIERSQILDIAAAVTLEVKFIKHSIIAALAYTFSERTAFSCTT